MDAIKLLKAGHYQIRDLLEDLCDTDTDASQVRSDLLAQAATALRSHARVGNEIFYPAFREVAKRPADIDLIHDAVEEHRAIVDLLLPHLQAADIASASFDGRAKVLRQLVEFHIRQQEGERFPRVKKLMSETERKALGERLLQRKQQLEGENPHS